MLYVFCAMQVCYADYGTVEWIDTPLRLLRLAVDFLLAIFLQKYTFFWCVLQYWMDAVSDVTND